MVVLMGNGCGFGQYASYLYIYRAETNRSPFDLPETENIIAGYQTEYGGMKFSLFINGEYTNMITTSAVMVTLFFGGWRAWFITDWLPFLADSAVGQGNCAALPVHLGTCRRWSPRYNQLMKFNWRFLLPFACLYDGNRGIDNTVQ